MTEEDRPHLPKREALAQGIAEHEAEAARQDHLVLTHETILIALRYVQRDWVHAGQEPGGMAEIAARVSDEPEKVALYRAAIAELAQLAEGDGDE